MTLVSKDGRTLTTSNEVVISAYKQNGWVEKVEEKAIDTPKTDEVKVVKAKRTTKRK